MKITVLMPVYNGANYIREAIDSILSQTFSDFEFLIINDGSTDQSESIIRSCRDDRIRLVHSEENRGLIFTLNSGLAMAKGEYIARMDQDDISMPDRLQKQFNFLEENSNIALVGGWAEIIDTHGEKIGTYKMPVGYDEIKFELLFRNPLIHGTIFFRKNIVAELGGYNENNEHAEDYGLYSTMIKDYQIVNLPEFLMKYRIHDHSIGQAPKTKSIQNETVRKIMFHNINLYLRINWNNFTRYYDAAHTRNLTLRGFFKSLCTTRNIYKSFIKKEHLNKEQVKKIHRMYATKNRTIMKAFFRR